MISRSLQIGWRHALRFKSYSIIKTAGLALGFASSIAILHFVSIEFSYDKFHRLSDNVYRLNTITQTPTGIQVQAAGTPLLAPTLMSEIPEVEAACGYDTRMTCSLKLATKNLMKQKYSTLTRTFLKY